MHVIVSTVLQKIYHHLRSYNAIQFKKINLTEMFNLTD